MDESASENKEKINGVIHPKNDYYQNISDLIFYYDRLYPFKLIFKWLTNSNTDDSTNRYNDSVESKKFLKREISFTCKAKQFDNNTEEVYIRWMSFSCPKTLKEKILNMKNPPYKIDIGAIYTIPISDRESYSKQFKAQEKELVFDIDLDDYDDIRSCCKDKSICPKCWIFLKIGIKVLYRALKEDFGCNDILFVYSGRRGIHCWVSDKIVRFLPSDGRGMIMDYLNLLSTSDNKKKKISLKNKIEHPSIERAYEICMLQITELLKQQNFFSHDHAHIEKLLSCYLSGQDDIVSREILRDWIKKKGYFTSTEFFAKLCDLGMDMKLMSDRSNNISSHLKSLPLEHRKKILVNSKPWLKEIVLSYSYPRFDVNVSKDIGHLLKAPFCVHPKTGRICVPLDYDNLDDFDPMDVPKLSSLRDEFDRSINTSNPETSTSLGNYICYFRTKFLPKLLKNSLKKNQSEDRIFDRSW